jgi:antitoxin component HigA of HigAB toxin-antitoxin module
MTVQFFKTPGGEEIAILPRAEYEALVDQVAAFDEDEDAADVAVYDARKAEGSAQLPPEVTAFMLRGDSLLKAVRNWRGLTQVNIEQATGIGQGYLSDLESGRRTGTPETLTKLAAALDVPTEWFVE